MQCMNHGGSYLGSLMTIVLNNYRSGCLQWPSDDSSGLLLYSVAL